MSQNKVKSISELAFAIARHCDDLQIYANGVAEDAVSGFAATEAAIMELVYELYGRFQQNGIPADYPTSKVLDSAARRVAEIRALSVDEMINVIRQSSSDSTKNESKYLFALVSAMTAGEPLAQLKYPAYTNIAKYGIYNGKTQKQLIERITSSDASRIYEAAINAIKDRRTLDEIRTAVRSELNKTRQYVKSETESVVNGLVNDVSLAFAAINGSNLMYVAVLDMNVCEECASHDGEIYGCDDPDIPAVPRHFHCRCRLLPVPLWEKNTNVQHSELRVSFEDYLASLSQSEQQTRLGKTKYTLWQAGEYKLKAYEPPRPGARISIAELKTRDQSAINAMNKITG